MPPARPRWPVVLAIVILASALRLWNIGAQSLWIDEGIAWRVATQPGLNEAVQADPTNPPLYFLLLYLNVRLAGDSEFALRWLSAACGILLVPLIYQLARRLFSPVAGLFAAVLIACSPPLWWASQEARMYALMAALAVAAALAWHQLIRKPTRNDTVMA